MPRERFIELHPGHKDVAYAYYLMGMDYYEQISDVGRDQEMTQKSQESFEELIRRFPNSDYSRDAQLKVDLITRPSGRQGDGDRPLLSAARVLARRHQPVPGRGRELPDHDPCPRGAPSADRKLTWPRA